MYDFIKIFTKPGHKKISQKKLIFDLLESSLRDSFLISSTSCIC